MIIVSRAGDVVFDLVSWPGCHFRSWCVVLEGERLHCLEGENNDLMLGSLSQTKVRIVLFV